MNKRETIKRVSEKMPNQRPVKFSKWMIIGLITYVFIEIIFIGVVDLSLNVALQSLALPFGMLFIVGIMLTMLLYWSRQSYGRPKACAMRFAFTIFSCSLAFMMALLLSAIKIGILSELSAVNDYAPYALFASFVGATVVYFMARKKLDGIHSESIS